MYPRQLLPPLYIINGLRFSPPPTQVLNKTSPTEILISLVGSEMCIRVSIYKEKGNCMVAVSEGIHYCLLYTSDAADD